MPEPKSIEANCCVLVNGLQVRIGPFASEHPLQDNTRFQESHNECRGCNFCVCGGFVMQFVGTLAKLSRQWPQGKLP